jgi:hypothetical protein
MYKPNVPDEIWLGRGDYSFWTDWKVNGWVWLATLIAAANDILFRSWMKQLPSPLPLIITVLPFLAILLWMRSVGRWVRGMDELHLRITLLAMLFATSATFFIALLWHRLREAGAFAAWPRAVEFDPLTITHVFLLMTFFYFLGNHVFTRRYQ